MTTGGDKIEALAGQIRSLFAENRTRTEALDRDVKALQVTLGEMRAEMAKQEGRKEGEAGAMTALAGRVKDVEDGLKELEKSTRIQDTRLTKLEESARLPHKLIYGAAALILVGVVSALIALVVSK